ncbi:MAG: hypothetical protein AW10_00498 [Candidatus Accumulibacter appositus]|uniref:Uncharacterized protein n=1 Tax=Candidatus Accumulibacter appositus TaxID=1454003 RepID=A0A011PZQ9_9PROT|nr:MAG: hypothetical protein AW10_00498 [Candidatus Accumulibacter appositus]
MKLALKPAGQLKPAISPATNLTLSLIAHPPLLPTKDIQ